MDPLFSVGRQADRANDLQPLDVHEHCSGTGRTGRKLEPGERAIRRFTASVQQAGARNAAYRSGSRSAAGETQRWARVAASDTSRSMTRAGGTTHRRDVRLVLRTTVRVV